MMNKKQTSLLGGLAKCALFLPLVAALLLFNSFDLASIGNTLQVMEKVSEAVPVTAPEDEPIFTRVETMPTFPGGDPALFKYIMDNLAYPKIAAEKGIQGRVALKFVIKADGTIDDLQVVKSLDPACDEEAVRVIKSMPKWNPGKQNGKAVSVEYSLPIVFKLSSGEEEK